MITGGSLSKKVCTYPAPLQVILNHDVKRIDKVFIKDFQMKKSSQLLICVIKINSPKQVAKRLFLLQTKIAHIHVYNFDKSNCATFHTYQSIIWQEFI